jgi:hypothetical protein
LLCYCSTFGRLLTRKGEKRIVLRHLQESPCISQQESFLARLT